MYSCRSNPAAESVWYTVISKRDGNWSTVWCTTWSLSRHSVLSKWHGPQVNMPEVMPIGKVWPSSDIVYKAHMFNQLYLRFSYTAFYQNWPANVESMDRNSIKAQITLWVHTEKSNKMQQCIKIYYSIFIWSSTCFWRHTAHHQEPKTAGSGLHMWKVVGCVVAGQSGRVWEGALHLLILCLTVSSNHTSNSLPRAPSHTLPDNVQQPHIQQPSTCTNSYSAWQCPTTTHPTTFHVHLLILCLIVSSNHTSNNLPHAPSHTLPDSVQQPHIQQPSTCTFSYSAWQCPATTHPTTFHVCKPEAASADLDSWWWAVCRPKHVELHINME